MRSRAWQGFKAFLDDMLYSLARKVRLPDTEFLLNLGDWPQVTRTAANGEPTDPVPVFAWYALGLALHTNFDGSYPPAWPTRYCRDLEHGSVVHQCRISVDTRSMQVLERQPLGDGAAHVQDDRGMRVRQGY
jgi:hypothetical protein